MVSSASEMDLQDLLEALRRIRREYAKDPEYRRLRAALPKSWPL